jgi:putative acetyltransferase
LLTKDADLFDGNNNTRLLFCAGTEPFYPALRIIPYFAPLKIFQMSASGITIRTIRKEDNAALARIIRKTLEEFGANHPGTVYFDETTDALFELFTAAPRSVYYVAEKDGEIVGGGGIYPSPGLPQDTCELVKMYLLPQVRGIGLGRRIIEACIGFASENGYKNIYIETMPELKQAMKTYEKFGFTYLDGPLGETGHFGCELWMLKKLEGQKPF